MPGDGGYGFDSNVMLRNGNSIMRTMRLTAMNPDAPSRPESILSRDNDGSEKEESKFDSDEVFVLGPGDEDAVPTPSPEEIQRGFESKAGSGAMMIDRSLRTTTNLPRLIIPDNNNVRPIRVSVHQSQPSVDSMTEVMVEGRPVRLLPRLNAQQIMSMPIGPVGLSRPLPTGPRLLPRLQLAHPYARHDTARPSFLPLDSGGGGAHSAPASQTVHRLTKMIVSPALRETPPETALSPMPSSAGLLVSSSSSSDKTPSSAEMAQFQMHNGGRDRDRTSQQPPARYRYINARSDFSFPIPRSVPPQQQPPPSESAALIPPPRDESVPAQWRPALSSAASRTDALSPPISEEEYQHHEGGPRAQTQMSRTPSFTSSEARQRSLYLRNFARSPSNRSRATNSIPDDQSNEGDTSHVFQDDKDVFIQFSAPWYVVSNSEYL